MMKANSHTLGGLTSARIPVKTSPVVVRTEDQRPSNKMRIFDRGGRWIDVPKRQTDQDPMIEVRLITPAMARDILENHSRPNRSMRRLRVKKYATAMTNGYWRRANPIHFDEDGNLRDGYHRINACVQSNKPIEFLVYFGMTDEELLSLDEGCARSTRDVATLRGIKASHASLSAISYLLEYADIKRITPREDEGIFQDRHLVAASWVCERLKKKPYSSNVVVALCIRAYYSCHDDLNKLNRLERFINILQGIEFPTAETAETDSAANVYKEHLINSERRSGTDRARLMRNGSWCLYRFLNHEPTRNVRRGNPVDLFPLPEEVENEGKIVI